MAEATQFRFDLREATLALLKQQGLREGKWMLSLELNLAAGVFSGPPIEGTQKLLPGAMMQVTGIQLVRAPEGELSKPVAHLLVDAADVK